jgi:oxygen-independent coproporphyrinogen-3 oxidase
VAGAYISYPFCLQKCSFCNFASGVFSPAAVSEYGERLLSEIRGHAWEWKPETVYFGGGTPSIMPEALLREIMRTLPGEPVETTLECAPGTATSERISLWAECGVNRISLGVQSFIEGELRRVGRTHTAEIVTGEIQALRAAGIENVNIDLIAGLPAQTFASWNESLHWLERLHPPHVSVYIFEIDEDSRLGREVLAGGARYGAGILPNDDTSAEFYEIAVRRLRQMGLHRYEISNFAQPGWESRHNLKYWRLEPYIGFGLDAHSFDGRNRWSNPDTLHEYCRGAPSPKDRARADVEEERFFIGLRLSEGIQPSASEWQRFAEPISKWLRDGFLERNGLRLRLSDRGVLVSNEILQDFTGSPDAPAI